MTTPEHDSFTYTLAEMDDGRVVFLQDLHEGHSEPGEITVSVDQWHAWNRPVQITARMGPV